MIRIQSKKYSALLDSAFNRELTTLFHRVWPESCPSPNEKITSAHHPSFTVQSFALYDDERLISYAGVLQQTIQHNKQHFRIAGLTCVATDPAFQGQGWGTLTVAAANEWLSKQTDVDLGLFTCAPALVPFYQKTGPWIVAPNLRVIGNQEEKALASDTLGVDVLVAPFSKKARSENFTQQETTITLDFPAGEFL